MQADATAPRRAPVTGYGILGGVFDPVHDAHLAAAHAALSELPIDEVRFVPAGVPPHKSDRAPAPAEERRGLLEIAIAGEPRFVLDDRELRRPGPSFTADTLAELAEERPGRRIFLLIGADNVPKLRTWRRAEEILRLCDPVPVPRPGHSARFRREDLPFASEERIAALNALALRGVSLDISSSEVRERVRAGESLEGWVPEAVAAEIARRGMYR